MAWKSSGTGEYQKAPLPYYPFHCHSSDTRRFCGDVLGREPRECYQAISICVLYNYFDWSLHQKVGRNGRKKRGTKKRSSLGTHWKLFRLVFERAMDERIGSKLNRGMHKVGIPSFSWCSVWCGIDLAGFKDTCKEARPKRPKAS